MGEKNVDLPADLRQAVEESLRVHGDALRNVKDAQDQPPSDLADPFGQDDGLSGVREPRRPLIPSGSAGAAAEIPQDHPLLTDVFGPALGETTTVSAPKTPQE